MGADFVHLHVHSDYSIGYSIAQIEPLLDRCAQLGMAVIALTDHGVLSGAVEFSAEAKTRGIHPILGCGFFIRPGEPANPAESLAPHLTLLAMDEKGYRNLCALSSIACRGGITPPRPEVDLETLAGHADGLIAFSESVSVAESLLDLLIFPLFLYQ